MLLAETDISLLLSSSDYSLWAVESPTQNIKSGRTWLTCVKIPKSVISGISHGPS